MPRRILCSFFILLAFSSLRSQDMLLPLQANVIQAEDNRILEEEANQKVVKTKVIKVDLNQSNIILVDDFSANKYRLNERYWKDRYVFVNNTFGKNPPSLGVVTFDGLDKTGYPYNFSQPTSYGACDTLTTLPMELGNITYSDPDEIIYLSFLYQAQGMNPFANSTKDSLTLQFKLKREKTISRKLVFTDSLTGKKDSTIFTQIVDDSKWNTVWSKEGSGVEDFKKVIIRLDSQYYRHGFQFRFVSYGNTSGSVDHWHIDNVFMSVGTLSDHENFNDVAYRLEGGSKLRTYESVPWKHYYDNPSYYISTKRIPLRMSNSYNTSVNVTLEYFAFDASGQQVDNITGVPGGVVLFGKDYKTDSMPIVGVANHSFQFPVSSEPDKNATTYFLKRNIMVNPDQSEIIKENNTMNEYQIFGTYYAYDDGSAEAGYGIRASGGKLAYKFDLRNGVTDSIIAIYIQFNPVVVNRNTEKFRFTIWGDNNGVPGDIIYQDNAIRTPSYPKLGHNYFQRIELDRPVVVSGTYFIGYEKFSTEVLNIGYDLNRDARNRWFFNIGNGWESATNGSVSEPGALMMRPSFSNVAEPQVGVKKERTQVNLNVELYPNPVRDVLYVNSNMDRGRSLEARIFDLRGAMLHSFIVDGEAVVNVSALDAGMYILQFRDRSNGLVQSTRFIVSK